MGAMNNGYKRMQQHDGVAVPMVSRALAVYGFDEHVIGQENDDIAIRENLRGKRDITSLMFRFRPDRLYIHPSYPPLACEIKSESGKYPNFAIEFDSYIASKGHGSIYKAVYAFVDLGVDTIKLCWTKDVLYSTLIWVPQNHPDWKKALDYLEVHYPTVNALPARRNNGSGTPNFVIPKNSSYLLPIDQFIKQELELRIDIDTKQKSGCGKQPESLTAPPTTLFDLDTYTEAIKNDLFHRPYYDD